MVIAAIDGELTVKRLKVNKDSTFLVAENPNYAPIKVPSESELVIWGVVVSVMRKL